MQLTLLAQIREAKAEMQEQIKRPSGKWHLLIQILRHLPAPASGGLRCL